MKPLTSRARFLAAAHCRTVDRPPVWLMRQAGRCLPEYRKLKERHDFLALAQTPELAAEVTLQPIRRFGFDAAIIFSDILVIPEALGQRYRFRDKGGIAMEFVLKSERDLKRLRPEGAIERLQYVAHALTLTRRELGDATALLGFGGSPWTLAHYMVEDGGGGGNADCAGLKALYHARPAVFRKLMEILTRTLIDYFLMQIQSGADAIQIFDSFGGSLAAADYEACSGRWIRRIITALGDRVPIIVFARGASGSLATLASTGADVLGFDWSVSLPDVALRLPKQIAVQGNLDPALLLTDPATVRRATRTLVTSMRGRKGFIVNLGHGVPPDSRLECIEALVQTVHRTR